MTIPDYQTLMLPLLRKASEAKRPVRELIGLLSDEFQLSELERRERIPSGSVTVIASRVHWAKTYLKSAGLLSQPQRGVVQITAEGTGLLKQNPARIDSTLLDRFAAFREFKARSRAAQSSTGEVDDVTARAAVQAATSTPEEQIDHAYSEYDVALRTELLSRVMAAPPAFFEALVVELLLAMGYGGSREDAGERLGGTGDGGVDGVIREDRLGLDLLYIQAKRYQASSKISVDTVRSFAGALNDVGAQKGILMTTSDFSADALAYAKRQQTKRIVLIDGDTLARYMVRFNVGVRLHRAIEIKRIDLEYFDDEGNG